MRTLITFALLLVAPLAGAAPLPHPPAKPEFEDGEAQMVVRCDSQGRLIMLQPSEDVPAGTELHIPPDLCQALLQRAREQEVRPIPRPPP